MTRPTTYDDALRSRLLTVAARLIADRGAAHVGLREIADAAQTSTTAVYSLFGGKTQLLTAVVDHGFTSFGDSQRAAAPGGLLSLGRAYRDWATRNPALYALMFSPVSGLRPACPPTPEVALSALTPLLETVNDALAAHESAQSPMAAAIAIWGQVHGLVSLEAAGTPPGTDWDGAYEAALHGIARAYLPGE